MSDAVAPRRSPLRFQGSPPHSEKSPAQLLTGLRRQFLQDLRYQKRSQSTIDWYARRLEKLERDTGIVSLEQLTRPVVQTWLIDIAGEGSEAAASAYVANCWRAMRGFLGWARRMGYEWHPSLVTVDGKFSLPCPQIGDKHPPIFTSEESHQLLAWPLKTRDALIVRIGLQTGIRFPSELIRLELGSVDRRPGFNVAGYLDVLGKRNKRRWVPVTNDLMKAIDFYVARIRPDAPTKQLILSSSGRAFTASALRALCTRLEKATGVHVHPYKFRHTFATEYLRKNRHDIEGLRKILGHEDYKTLRNYVRLVREDLGDNWDGRVPFE